MNVKDDKMSDVKQVLEAARNRIIDKGWCQRSFWNGHGHCMLGALAASCPTEDDGKWGEEYPLGIAELVKVINPDLAADPRFRPCNDGYFAAVRFNDAPERTREEVLEVFAKAIEALS